MDPFFKNQKENQKKNNLVKHKLFDKKRHYESNLLLVSDNLY